MRLLLVYHGPHHLVHGLKEPYCFFYRVRTLALQPSLQGGGSFVWLYGWSKIAVPTADRLPLDTPPDRIFHYISFGLSGVLGSIYPWVQLILTVPS